MCQSWNRKKFWYKFLPKKCFLSYKHKEVYNEILLLKKVELNNMNTRYLYLVFVALFAYLLFFSYTSEQKQSKEESLSKVSANYKDSELIRNSVLIQNDSLEIYVDPFLEMLFPPL